MITYFNSFLKINFNKYLKSYFSQNNYLNKFSDFNNYFNFINDLDKFSSSFIIDILMSILNMLMIVYSTLITQNPFVCADLVEKSADNSYSKAGKIIADKIGNKTSFNSINISRATVKNIVLGFEPVIDENKERKRIEKFVGSQFNNGIDHMIKSAVIFENTKLKYKTNIKKLN